MHSSHVVHAVSNLDENYADIVTDCKQHFPVVFKLHVIINGGDTTDFGQTIDEFGNIFTKHAFDIIKRIITVFYDIMHQRRSNTGRAKTNFRGNYLRYLNRMSDIGFSRFSPYPVVCIIGKSKSTLYQIDIVLICLVFNAVQ